MSLTYAQLKERFYRLAGVDSSASTTATFPDALVMANFNAAIRWIVRQTKNSDFYTVSELVNLATGDVALPTNNITDLLVIYAPNGVTNTQGTSQPPLLKRTEIWMDQNMSGWRTAPNNNQPSYVVLKKLAAGFTYRFYPQPGATLTNQIFLRYAKSPTPFTVAGSTTDVLANFPEYEETLLLYRACATLLRFDGGAKNGMAEEYRMMAEGSLLDYQTDLNALMLNAPTEGGRGR